LSDGGEVGAVGSVEGPQLVLPVQA
jgi:hypothetical protein